MRIHFQSQNQGIKTASCSLIKISTVVCLDTKITIVVHLP